MLSREVYLCEEKLGCDQKGVQRKLLRSQQCCIGEGPLFTWVFTL